MVYLITYDLRVPGQNYSDLIKEIKAVGYSWAKPCESTWFIKTTLTAEAIKNKLNAIDATDKVMVIAVSSPWSTNGLDKDVLDWMHTNI